MRTKRKQGSHQQNFRPYVVNCLQPGFEKDVINPVSMLHLPGETLHPRKEPEMHLQKRLRSSRKASQLELEFLPLQLHT